MALAASNGSLATASTGLAADARSLSSLKATASSSPEKATKLAAREFEALFLNQLLKSMRESLPKDGPFSSQAGTSYTQMLDQELSKSLAAKGTGLATMIEKQLRRTMTPATVEDGAKSGAQAASQAAASATGSLATKAYAQSVTPATAVTPKAVPAAQSAAATAGSATPGSTAPAKVAPKGSAAEDQSSFLSKVTDMARASAAAVGLSPVFVAAQAALESGWGKHEIRHADGSSAHNLFSIKAGANWNGPTVDVTTTEYQNGVAVKKVEKFRAYASYAEGLADYVGLLAGNARYKDAVANGQDAKGFAQAMGKSGYATDPAYGQKLARLIDKAKNLTGQA